jgi:putative chitinase
MIFTAARLRDLCPQPPSGTLDTLADALEDQAPQFAVSNLIRRAHFMGQMAHESAGFKRFVENLNYSAHRIEAVWPRLRPRAQALANKPEALGNAAYADRMGNGDEASGDGYRFAGKGLIQLTGRNNYRDAGGALGLDLLSFPARAAEPINAVKIALWFWASHRCNAPADQDDVEEVTRRINGGLNGLEERRGLTERAKAIFLDEPLVA